MSNVNTLEGSQATHQLKDDSSERSSNGLVKAIKKPVALTHEHLFTISVVAILIYGWSRRDDNYISAENGAGYILGIVGGSLMLLLILYPISKRTELLKRLIPMRFWFGMHMLFGIIGPVMILFHSNFHIGSMNSTVALLSMLLVAFSGLIGRYIYTRIHHGLYGKRITLGELKQEAEAQHSELLRIYRLDKKLNQRQTSMETRALQNYTGVTRTLIHGLLLSIDSRRLRSRTRKLLKAACNRDALKMTPNKAAVIMGFVDRYSAALHKIVVFRIYERLFSFWHVLHLPLFIMMIITAIIHIFAVHMY
ncbi:MAG: hypothetical protein JSW45_07870 [Thiotrichales bacterium]|nr:MAG: hypothetical protein JSW45_07870 [Thiotrichales bacterium]